MVDWEVVVGDCIEVLKTLPNASIDAVVTDPPYELGFMGKKWDATGIANSVELWREVLRVLKPGGHLLSFGGTRTYHRMTCVVEDAGFEIRDSIMWIFGTGFPKSLNLGEGRGTALKPGHEPICVARKPLIGTVAQNVQAHGTGTLNIDACRIGYASAADLTKTKTKNPGRGGELVTSDVYGANRSQQKVTESGRWPANVILDEDAAAELDEQAGVRRSAGTPSAALRGADGVTNLTMAKQGAVYDDTGSASRFFYVAKPSRRERDLGCDSLPARSGGEATDRDDETDGLKNPRAGAGRTGGARNHHPTVKPVTLMRYLVRLVTPPSCVVLDPFCGSGTTGMAAVAEGFDFLGVELSEEYAQIARLRIAAALEEKRK